MFKILAMLLALSLIFGIFAAGFSVGAKEIIPKNNPKEKTKFANTESVFKQKAKPAAARNIKAGSALTDYEDAQYEMEVMIEAWFDIYYDYLYGGASKTLLDQARDDTLEAIDAYQKAYLKLNKTLQNKYAEDYVFSKVMKIFIKNPDDFQIIGGLIDKFLWYGQLLPYDYSKNDFAFDDFNVVDIAFAKKMVQILDELDDLLDADDYDAIVEFLVIYTGGFNVTRLKTEAAKTVPADVIKFVDKLDEFIEARMLFDDLFDYYFWWGEDVYDKLIAAGQKLNKVCIELIALFNKLPSEIKNDEFWEGFLDYLEEVKENTDDVEAYIQKEIQKREKYRQMDDLLYSLPYYWDDWDYEIYFEIDYFTQSDKEKVREFFDIFFSLDESGRDGYQWGYSYEFRYGIEQLLKAFGYMVTGDINDDGLVDIEDLLLLKKHVLKIAEITGDDAYFQADMNFDWNVDIEDLLIIKKVVLKLI